MDKNKSILTGIIIGVIILFAAYIVIPNTVFSNHDDYLSSMEVNPSQASYVVVGASDIKVPPNSTVVTQVDRVIRDKVSHYNDNVTPDTRPSSYKELVPWMEGARVGELMKYANVSVIPASGVPVKKIKGRYFGPDNNGNFIFEVDPSKISPVYSNKISNDTWNIVDTHGMNVLAPEAIKDHAISGCCLW